MAPGTLYAALLVAVLGGSVSAAGETEPDLELGPVQILVGDQRLRVEAQRWRLGWETGIAWRARALLPARVQVLDGDGIRPLARLLPSDEGPWAALNGAFYDVDNTPMGVVVADGVTLAPFRRGGGSGVLVVEQGWPRIIHHSEFESGYDQALQSIDRIIAAGVSLVRQRSDARATARAAVAVSGRAIYLIAAASDASVVGVGDRIRLRGASLRGLPLWAFTDYILASTDATDALNLDGSVSVQFAARVGDREIRVGNLGGTVNGLLIAPAPVSDRRPPAARSPGRGRLPPGPDR